MTRLRLHVILRSTGGENRKRRPAFYSKRSCLQSLLRAVASCHGRGELVFLNDGAVPAGRLELMEGAGHVVQLGGLGLQGAYLSALREPARRGWADGDLVYLAEDDYLYRPEAFAELARAAVTLPAVDCFAFTGTLRGVRPGDDPLLAGLRLPPLPGEALGDGWRRGLSHTASFAVRPAALRRDVRLHAVALHAGGSWDHAAALAYQGLAPYTAQDLRAVGVEARRGRIAVWRLALTALAVARKRAPHVLAIADPALATHVETAVLAPGTDWEAEAARPWPA